MFLIKYYILNVGLYDNLLNRNFTLNVFTCATIIYILLIFFKKNYLIHGVFPLLLIFNISTINTYVAFFIFMLYLSLTNIKTKLIHVHTLIFFIFINLQVYVFDNNFVEFFQNFYIKVNNTNSVVCSCLLTDRFGVWCKNAVFFVTDSTAYADEIILKVISEKSLFGFIKNSTFYFFEDMLVTQHFIFVFFSSVIFIISLSLNVNLTTTTMKFF